MTADGLARIFTTSVSALVDTNILVYRYDPRFPDKQRTATDALRRGIENDALRLPHQAVVEFVAAVTRVRLADGQALLPIDDALQEAEQLLQEFEVLYPDEEVVHTALRGAALYKFSWFDAHLWAYAEAYGVDEILSEDFQHGRQYGSVRIRNPFLSLE
jgi:predicted nucleic acid-binding protein